MLILDLGYLRPGAVSSSSQNVLPKGPRSVLSIRYYQKVDLLESLRLDQIDGGTVRYDAL